MKKIKLLSVILLVTIALLTTGCEEADAIKGEAFDIINQSIEQVQEQTNKAKETIENLKNIAQPPESNDGILPTVDTVREPQEELLKMKEELNDI